MKIGIVLPALPAYSETFFRNKILGLQQNGHVVFLFVNNSDKGDSYLNCEVINGPRLSGNKAFVILISLWQLIKAIFNLNKSTKLYRLNEKDGVPIKQNIKQILANQFLLSEKLDWLHFGYGTMALGRENIAQVIGAKMAVSFRGFDIGIYPLKNPKCYEKLWQKVDRIHTISDDITALVYKNGFQDKEKVVKICPAVDVNHFKGGHFPENMSAIQITTIARLHWKKGLEYTLDALAVIKQKGIDFHYKIIGDGPEKERLEFAINQFGLQGSVSFTGVLSPEAVKRHLCQTDLYLQYSVQEGFCNAVLEAQAMGNICIVSDAEGLAENVLDGVTGFVVPKRKPLSLANKIVEVINLSENEKRGISNKAIERVKINFSIEKQIKEFLKFYEEN